jgi:rod shape-determining protein MreC
MKSAQTGVKKPFQWLVRHQDLTIVLTAVAGSICLMVLDRNPVVQSAKQGVQHRIGIIESAFSRIPRLGTVLEENRRLETEMGRLSIEGAFYREAILENHRLRRLLGFMERSPGTTIPAQITGRGSVGVPGAVHLNVGWAQGCRKNMAMITENGVAGKLISVARSASVGQLVTDPNFRISARVERSRVLGIVRWLYGNLCRMDGVPLRSDVRAGDRVVTSGYSTVYPAGLRIGQVVEVDSIRQSLFKTITLRTDIDFQTLENVLVLKPSDPSGPDGDAP